MHPLAVVITKRCTAKSAMVLAGARRAAGAMHGHMHFVDHVELLSQMACQQSRQARSHCGADHQGCVVHTGAMIEFKQRAHIVEIVAERHNRHPVCQQPCRKFGMRRRKCEHHHIGGHRVVEIEHYCRSGSGNAGSGQRRFIDNANSKRRIDRQQLGNACSGNADAHHHHNRG